MSVILIEKIDPQDQVSGDEMKTRTQSSYDFLKYSAIKNRSYQVNNPLAANQYSFPHSKTLEFLSEGVKALDWGCRNGHFSRYLLYNNIHTISYSFDDYPEGLEGEEPTRFRHVKGDHENPTEIPFPDSEFDLVFSVGVLEHVHETGGDQRQSILEIRRILKPGGCFLCFHLPQQFSWVETAVGVVSRFVDIPGSKPHSKKFTLPDIKRLCSDAELDLLEVGTYNFLPRNITGKIIPGLSQSAGFVRWFDRVDLCLSRIFPIFCSQIYFVAKKKGPS